MSAKRSPWQDPGIALIVCAFACLAVLFGVSPSDLRAQSVNSSSPPPLPPVARVKPVTDVYHGPKVVDPYRYMENLKDPDVGAWMKAQNDYTRARLAEISGHDQLLARIRTLDETVPQVQAARLPGDLFLVTQIMQCAPKAQITRGGRTHSNSCWLDLIACERPSRGTG